MENNPNDDPNQLDYAKVPIVALRQPARCILSRSLNPGKVLPSEEGFPRDWRGIAHLAGLQSLYGPVINAEADPMAKVLSLWNSEGNETANFDNLVKFLGVIDRWDVADDLSEDLVKDAQAYKSKQYQQQLIVSRHEASIASKAEVNVEDFREPDANILTKDDAIRAQVGLPPQQYDAFVLFADEDIEFATELIERMEVNHPRFGFKLCVKDRDLIASISFEHEAIMRLIAERCNRLIVIISAAFLKSSANTFFVNFASAFQIEQRRRKIIPCLYENCVLPLNLSFYFHLKYHQSGKLFNFWDKLSDSIRSTNPVPQPTVVPSIQITDITDTPQQVTTKALPAITSTPNTIAVPVKLPRKKTAKLSAADPMKIHTKPEPIIRKAFSMKQLNAPTQNDDLISGQSLSVVNCDINHSESNLSEISSTKSLNGKSKWYTKLLLSKNSGPKTNSSLSVGSSVKSCESITKPKSKRNWLKKRLTSSTN